MSSKAIQLSADFAEMQRLAEWVETQAAEFALDARQIYAIQLCLEEVVANLVLHARPVGAGPVAITVRLDAEPLRVTVEDDGVPFDPTVAEPAALPASLEEAAPGGLGLTLLQHFSASREYAHSAGRNRLVLGFG